MKKRFSQTNWAMKKWYALDTFEWGFPVSQEMVAPLTASTTRIKAATTLGTWVTTTITTWITNPDVLRAVSITWNASWIVGNVVITWTNWANRVVTDTIAASGASTVEWVVAFKTITKIVLPARNAGWNTIAVWTTDKLGLYRSIEATSDIVSVYVDSSRMAPVTQVDTVSVTGTSGTANITVAWGLTKLATFDTDLTTTAANFVTAHAAAYLAVGIVVTSAVADLVFTANVSGTAFAHPVITNATWNLAGTVANTTANTAATAVNTTHWTVKAVTATNGTRIFKINYLTSIF